MVIQVIYLQSSFQQYPSPQAADVKNTYYFAPLDSTARQYMLDLISEQSRDCRGESLLFCLDFNSAAEPVINDLTLSIVVGLSTTILFLFILILGTILFRKFSTPSSASEEKERLLANPISGGTVVLIKILTSYSDEFLFRTSPPSSMSYDEFFYKQSIKIQDDELTFDEIIGRGTFSCVYSGMWRGRSSHRQFLILQEHVLPSRRLTFPRLPNFQFQPTSIKKFF